MGKKIIWSEEALAWLDNVYNYVSQDKPMAATNLLENLIGKVELLSDNPFLGHQLTGHKQNVRLLNYGHYRVVYVVDDESAINIVGIFHGALDIKKHLKL